MDQSDEGYYRCGQLNYSHIRMSYLSPILQRVVVNYMFSIFNCRCEVQNGVGELSKTIYLDVQGGCCKEGISDNGFYGAKIFQWQYWEG